MVENRCRSWGCAGRGGGGGFPEKCEGAAAGVPYGGVVGVGEAGLGGPVGEEDPREDGDHLGGGRAQWGVRQEA